MKFIEKVTWQILFFAVGLLAGLLAKDWPYLQLNREVGIMDVASFFTTLAIAIIIPITIKKVVEDNRDIKSFLVEEAKELISIITEINRVIDSSHSVGKFDMKDRDKINYTFHTAELKIDSIREQIKISFPNEIWLVNRLTDNYEIYHDFLTGGEMMLSTFTSVDERFYKEHNTSYSKLQTNLKGAIHKIYKF